MDGKQKNSVYEEVQWPGRWFFFVIIGTVTGIFWYAFIQQILLGVPLGDQPMTDSGLILAWVVFGILLPLFSLKVNMTTQVRDDGVYVKLFPFHLRYRKFLHADIEKVSSIRVRSLVRFGGWGIRVNFSGEKLYNTGGREGVELILKSGEVVVIGSRKAEALAAAVQKRID
ncbi:DUF6141 family protein [Halobacillus sp. ACCC02827]|uniref:DUF6141 family protein n=1 Tax=Halobacillus sp. ACCC02827 TaxID=3052090 RepID=UPI0025703EFA|nr:DUF6141 family protein [Halobacillus sp. ACCC02827]WJE15085.1 DUF6141 family protein [Halobacillus sp. ACCC02827]